MRPARRHPALVIAVLTVILLSTVSEGIYGKQQQLQGLNGQIVATRTQIRQLLDQERALQAQIAALDAQLASVQAQIDQETAKLVLLGQQVEQAKEELATKQAELAKHIRGEPGFMQYSVYRPLGDDNGPLLVIQMYASVEAYQEHNSWVRGQLPRISELLAAPPAPPALFEPVPLE